MGAEHPSTEPRAPLPESGTPAAAAAAAGVRVDYIDVSGGVRSHDLPGAADPVAPRSTSTRRRGAPRAAARLPLRPGAARHLRVDFCGLRARVIHPDGRQSRRRLCGARRGDAASVRAEIPPFLQISDKTEPPRKETAATAERYMLGQRLLDPSPEPSWASVG